MAAKEKMVARINRIENENRELKAKLEKYESGELQSDVPDSVVWGMYLSSRKSIARFKEQWQKAASKNKELQTQLNETLVKRQKDLDVMTTATNKLEELQQEIEELKEDNEALEEMYDRFKAERDAALDMLESEFCKSEMLSAMIEANHKLETKLAEHEM